MAKTIALIGAGRVGQSLARALRRRGYRIGAVVTRGARTARRAARFIGGGRPSARPEARAVSPAEVILLSTPDSGLGRAAHALAHLDVDWRGKVVLHTSGCLSSEDLGVMQELGAAVGSLHPLYPFAERIRNFPRGVVFGVEGNRRAVTQAKALARALGGRPVQVHPGGKALYHAGAVLAAGHVVTLLDLSARALRQAGVSPRRARETLLPLAREALESYARQGSQAWTGPVQRGEGETVWHHLVALQRLPPAYLEVYVALARAGMTLYRKDRSRRTRELRRLLEM